LVDTAHLQRPHHSQPLSSISLPYSSSSAGPGQQLRRTRRHSGPLPLRPSHPQAHGSLEEIFRALPELKAGDARKLEAGREAAARSAELVRLAADVPLQVGGRRWRSSARCRLRCCLRSVPATSRACGPHGGRRRPC
jgi:hypothetical protein